MLINKNFSVKQIFILFLKLSLTFGLLYWIVDSGKLDLSQTKIIIEKKWFFILFVIPALFLCMIIQNLRWWLVLRCMQIKIPFNYALVLTWIGNFFNTVLPGLVSGDVLKGIYLQKETTYLWTPIYTSLLVDRLLGLLGLLFLFLFSSLKFGLENKEFLHNISLFIKIGIMGVGVFLLFLFLPTKWKTTCKKWIPDFLQTAILSQVWQSFAYLRCKKKELLFSVILSVTIHLIICLIIYKISLLLFPESLSFWQQALLIPLGLVVTALPIAPAGVGVGHIAFDNLYNLFNFQGGATLFNIFIINQIIVFISGAIPFLFFKKK